ncbi:MAG: Ferredoxin reductase [Betaproteobacteria bacterium]|jgi:NTE family protein|nr:Ferredoxin reductase [Betaproteobacteria bacterium]
MHTLSKSNRPIRLAIALQGGGSHGAFTWGVLDRLLQEPAFEIVGISGTSAGAMNAAVLADGLRRGGADEARQALEHYWNDVGSLPGYASFEAPALFGAERTWHLEHNPVFLWQEMLTRICSPYESNPFNYHPLRSLLGRIDFEGLRGDPRAARLFICATNVRTGLRRVFENHELSADVLLASAALPQVYQAVEIGGEHYWDGAYTGNPALAPLYLGTEASDVIVVGINPIVRGEVPRTARAISDRIGEISFNSSFMGEVAAIAFFEELMQSRPADPRFRRLFVHGIGDEALGAFGASSKMNNHPEFLRHLHEIGRRAAEQWLAEHRNAIGNRSTVDLSGLAPTRHGSLIGPSIIKHRHEVKT